MGYLEDKSVYLSGAMDMAEKDGTTWRDFIRPRLERYGLEIFDPTRKKIHKCEEVGENKTNFKKLIKEENFEELKKEFDPIARWDLRSVDKADFMIVGYIPGIPVFGTVDEIVVANMQRKPILMKYDRSKLHKFSTWAVVRIDPKHFFATWENLFSYLDVIDSGEIDERYWTL
jgi:hypothetical protein